MKGRSAPGLFEISGLYHEYGGRRVLDVPDFKMSPGKIYALVGPNGSGKTTLLSVLNLLIFPTGGEIRYRGEPVGADHASRRRHRLTMSMLLQDPYLFNTSVRSNVAWGLKARQVPGKEIHRRVSRALSLVGLEKLEDRRARTLSGGEAQRTALARAMATEPEVLLLDEFTANIDPQSAAALEAAIGKICKEGGVTVFMTTHNLEQAYRLADEVYTLFNGRLIPAPMDNLFSGRLTEEDGHHLFRTTRAAFQVPAGDDPSGVTHAMIHPEDILVSLKTFVSSARNVLPGTVSAVTEEGGTARLRVEAGETFTVNITGESCRELSLGLGSRVYLTFKASSVHLL